MGRRHSDALPGMRLHKPTGCARVYINGKEYWLGKFGSPEAQLKYDERRSRPTHRARSHGQARCTARRSPRLPASRNATLAARPLLITSLRGEVVQGRGPRLRRMRPVIAAAGR